MSETLSKLFMQVSKRSEKISQETLIKSFVDVGPLFSVMDTIDNQIFYGRRGTGKTHALIYLSRTVQDRNDIPVYIDLRSIGSTAGIYADGTLPLPERSTRLLMDMLSSVHDGLVNAALDESVGLNLSKMGPVLDELAEAITEVVVTGEVVEEVGLEDSSRTSASESVGLKASNKSISTEYGSRETKEDSTASHKSSTTKGVISHRVNFGRVGSLLSSLTKEIEGKRIWLLLDEWSAVPIELQPYLADLIRRAIFPAANITVKIAAIENRSKFQIPLEGGDYIGIELGGDASADFNMDDFMVFDNDEEQAIQFFKTLIFRKSVV